MIIWSILAATGAFAGISWQLSKTDASAPPRDSDVLTTMTVRPSRGRGRRRAPVEEAPRRQESLVEGGEDMTDAELEAAVEEEKAAFMRAHYSRSYIPGQDDAYGYDPSTQQAEA